MATQYLNEGAVALAAADWGGTAPTNGDTAIIERGSSTITGSTLSDFTAGTGFVAWEVRAGFSGNLGTGTGDYLAIDVDVSATSTFLYAATGGSCYVKPGGASSVISVLNINSRGGSFFLVVGGTVTLLNVQRGRFTAKASTVIVTANLSGGNCIIETSGTAITTLTIMGGSHVLKRSVTTLNMVNGSVNYDGDSTTIGTLNMYGGTFKWMNGAVTAGTWYGGTVDASDLRRDQSSTVTAHPLARYTLSSRLTLTLTQRGDYSGGFNIGGAPNL